MIFGWKKAHIWQKMQFSGHKNSIFQGVRLSFLSNVPGGTFIHEDLNVPGDPSEGHFL